MAVVRFLLGALVAVAALGAALLAAGLLAVGAVAAALGRGFGRGRSAAPRPPSGARGTPRPADGEAIEITATRVDRTPVAPAPPPTLRT